MAAPVVAAIGTVARALSGTSVTVLLPAGIATGDLMVMAIGQSNGASVCAPSSAGVAWTQVGSVNNGGACRSSFYYKFAGAGEGNATLSIPVNGIGVAAFISRVTGANATATPTFQVVGDNVTTPLAPAISTNVADQMVMHLWSGDAAGGQAAYTAVDAGVPTVLVNECNAGSLNQQFMVGTEPVAVAGTVAARTATSTYAIPRSMVTLAIQPPGAGLATLAEWYGKAIEGQWSGTAARRVDWLNDTTKVALTTSSYVPNQDTHTFFSDVTNEITGTGYTAGGVALASKTLVYDAVSNTLTYDAADSAWASSTLTARYAVIYKDTGTASTSPLIAFVDFGFDMSDSAGTFTIQWAAGGILQAVVNL